MDPYAYQQSPSDGVQGAPGYPQNGYPQNGYQQNGYQSGASQPTNRGGISFAITPEDARDLLLTATTLARPENSVRISVRWI